MSTPRRFAVLILCTFVLIGTPRLLPGESAILMTGDIIGALEQTRKKAPKKSKTKPSSTAQELRKLSARVAGLKSENDSLKARTTVLEKNIKTVTSVLPEIQAALRMAVSAKAVIDSSELAMITQLSLLLNKISLLEEKTVYIDSTNFEILSQLVLLENKIVSLTNSFNDMLAARQTSSAPSAGMITDEQFRQRYITALTAYQNGEYADASQQFQSVINENMRHDLADNAQYWIGECHYAMKQFKQAISEFERVFQYSNSDKADDAQFKIALSFWNSGNERRARQEFTRLSERFPDSELNDKTRQYLN